MSDFFQQYFIDPILQGNGYNIYNTLAYAAVLIVAVLATYKLLKKIGIKIDNKFIIGVLPYIIFGGLLRALEDASSYGIWFKTPLIYIVIFVIALAGLLVSSVIEKKKKISYHKTWFVIGSVMVLAGLTQVAARSTFALAAIVTLSVFWAVLLIFAKKLSERLQWTPASRLLSWENTAILWAHMFDATATFTAIQYFPYFEQHVLPGFLIDIFGPAIMFVLKFAVVGAVLYVLDKEMKQEKEKRKFIKLIILILGLAPGLRDAFRLIMGV